MSTVVDTIAEQVRVGLGWERPRYKLIQMSDVTLRVHRPSRPDAPVVNTDITYDRGRDLYDVERHVFTGAGDDLKTKRYEGVYVDSLADIIRGR